MTSCAGEAEPSTDITTGSNWVVYREVVAFEELLEYRKKPRDWDGG